MTELAAPQISSLMEALPGIAAVLRSPVANAIVALSRAAAGLEEFDAAHAEELLRFGVRRNLLTQDEVDTVLAELRVVVASRPKKIEVVVEKVKKLPPKPFSTAPAPRSPEPAKAPVPAAAVAQLTPAPAAAKAPPAKKAELTKPAPKPPPSAAKAALKPTPKAAAKVLPKAAPKPVAKPVAKAPVKPVAKAPAKPPAKAPGKAPAKPAAKAAPARKKR